VSAVILASGGVRTDCEPIVVRPADDFSYSYLLGAYLGDGYVACTGRTYQLVVSLDAAFPADRRRVRGGHGALFADR
jgi:hypothetical protein